MISITFLPLSNTEVDLESLSPCGQTTVLTNLKLYFFAVKIESSTFNLLVGIKVQKKKKKIFFFARD